MEWANVTYEDVAGMAKEEVCIIPIGCLEPHAWHLPTGNDALIAHRWAQMAAEREPAMVLPPLYYAYVKPGRHLPGAISLETDVLLALLENVCDEVARNGFKKIILLNGHGGNSAILEVFSQHLSDRGKDYAVYFPPIFLMEDVIREIGETTDWGHACEIETSISLYLFPELCKMDRLPEGYFRSKKDFDIGPAKTSMDWFASHPETYIGDAHKASVEKGRRMTEAQIERLVAMIRKIKKDEKVLAKMREYQTF